MLDNNSLGGTVPDIGVLKSLQTATFNGLVTVAQSRSVFSKDKQVKCNVTRGAATLCISFAKEQCGWWRCSGGSFSLSCPKGSVITQIVYASWGLGSLDCTALTWSWAAATDQKPFVQNACVGKESCGQKFSYKSLGDPAPNKSKTLFIIASCSTQC